MVARSRKLSFAPMSAIKLQKIVIERLHGIKEEFNIEHSLIEKLSERNVEKTSL